MSTICGGDQTALWRYHHETGTTDQLAAQALKDQANSWTENKFLLIQGDFFGIQDFIFASGGETNKRAAKLLRGRSFYVSLLSECAALKVLDALNLPATSQVINAAGKFMIVAPNTNDTKASLKQVRAELNQWFLAHSFGQAGVGLAWTEASCKDFQRGKVGDTSPSPYKKLIEKLFKQLEIIKNQRFDLCGNHHAPKVFTEFLDSFDNSKGVCKIDGRSAAKYLLDNQDYISELALDQINTGTWLAKHERERILITRETLNMDTSLKITLFGYHVSFAKSEDAQGKFGREAQTGNLLRAWDFSLPTSADKALWNGYARRNINAYIPVFDDKAQAQQTLGKYGNEPTLDLDDVKTLNHIDPHY